MCNVGNTMTKVWQDKFNRNLRDHPACQMLLRSHYYTNKFWIMKMLYSKNLQTVSCNDTIPINYHIAVFYCIDFFRLGCFIVVKSVWYYSHGKMFHVTDIPVVTCVKQLHNRV